MSGSVDLDALVIGGGVVGLAVARALAQAGREVTVIEAEGQIGSHASSRNSEVIHAGIYYASGSLKARACVLGRDALYAYCETHEIPHRRVGKVIVATREEEVSTLEKLKQQAEANGVTDLYWLDRAEVNALEPEIIAFRGLFSPSTGIVDSHAYMSALRRDAERAGAQVVLSTPVLGGRVESAGITLDLGGVEPVTVTCRTVINSAGLRAPEVARAIAGMPREHVPPQLYAKGHYFVLPGRAPFRHLVYPVPVPGGLGVHVTLDLAGQARFGPDVSWLDSIDYSFDEQREASFYEAIRRYFPALPNGSLSPGYTGIRAKTADPKAPAQDFVVQGPRVHGVPGLLNLFGIESPGLTSSLALADLVLAELAQ